MTTEETAKKAKKEAIEAFRCTPLELELCIDIAQEPLLDEIQRLNEKVRGREEMLEKLKNFDKEVIMKLEQENARLKEINKDFQEQHFDYVEKNERLEQENAKLREGIDKILNREELREGIDKILNREGLRISPYWDELNALRKKEEKRAIRR